MVLPIASLIMNLRFWWNKRVTWNTWTSVMEEIDIYTLTDIADFMKTFKWTADKYIDWKPWVHTIFANNMKDDCDGAAVLGKWLLGKMGIDARIVKLWKTGKSEGHTICVSKDDKIMISNNDVIDLNPLVWKDKVISYHKNAYDIVRG